MGTCLEQALSCHSLILTRHLTLNSAQNLTKGWLSSSCSYLNAFTKIFRHYYDIDGRIPNGFRSCLISCQNCQSLGYGRNFIIELANRTPIYINTDPSLISICIHLLMFTSFSFKLVSLHAKVLRIMHLLKFVDPLLPDL